MLVYAVDLGTTNVKVVLFDEDLHRLAVACAPATYDRAGERVEFSPDALFATVLDLVHRCHRDAGEPRGHEAVLSLTGQAESLVLNDADGRPVRPGLSWLDARAAAQAREIGEEFGVEDAFARTGQPVPTATWPAAKLRWLAQHEPATLRAAAQVLMVKDDLVRRLVGTSAGELTTRGFSYLYDIRARRWWTELLDFLDVPEKALAEVVPAGTDLGPVLPAVADLLPTAESYRVNAGALDHFCAMAGTGSYVPGVVSESAGTVLSLSVLVEDWTFDPARRVSYHPGLRAGETVLFDGIDCGAVALDWFRREGLAGIAFEELEDLLRNRPEREAPFFLPYLTGVNPPDYFPDAHGAFLDLDLGHGRADLAHAVQEGVAHLLRRTVDHLGTGVHQIVSTGGGAGSAHWNQLKADVCGVDLLVPAEREATCRGAAVLALVAAGRLGDLDEAPAPVPAPTRYRAHHGPDRARRYARFEDHLTRLFGL
ncbi:FGGY-family carbohydrate kinase [Kineococcus rhizosphaerae]|uniref:Gluconokinase/xylulokinase n=1 Tax=Kineococcus rhizosphaerae TaxID=559628 RepID=A0A2T0RBK4_9ACTN|nr:FGGY family carbohydrate kinase [Kineococcus rhizosphaerae]PRY18556.1 gluconokinase/xylulokinase [Kineococcus rhizosphaerae]